MVRSLLLLIAVLAIAASALMAAPPTTNPSVNSNSATTQPAFVFRSVNWGWSKKQVMATEQGKPMSDDPVLLYDAGTVGGLKAAVGYMFHQDKLAGAGYHFMEDHTNKNDFIEDYAKISEVLEKKYGKPKEVDVDWKDQDTRPEKSRLGLAVATGRLTMSRIWWNGDTKIIHSLRGDNFEIKHNVSYVDWKARDAVLKDHQKDESSKF